MLFPTVEYAVFFLVVLAMAWPLARRVTAHKIFLLLASYVFYGFWSWRYVPLLISVSLFAGLMAQAIKSSCW
jgi:alginate O-acetyltransferase complex protein AlgI